MQHYTLQTCVRKVQMGQTGYQISMGNFLDNHWGSWPTESSIAYGELPHSPVGIIYLFYACLCDTCKANEKHVQLATSSRLTGKNLRWPFVLTKRCPKTITIVRCSQLTWELRVRCVGRYVFVRICLSKQLTAKHQLLRHGHMTVVHSSI